MFEGTIEIDGVDTQRIPVSQLRKSIALVSPTPFLFPGTIRDNVDPFGLFQDASTDFLLKSLGMRIARNFGLDAELSRDDFWPSTSDQQKLYV